jgi:hypothetical protein
LLEPRLTAALTWPRAQRPRPRRLVAPGFLNSAFHRAETAVSPIRGVPQQAFPTRRSGLLHPSFVRGSHCGLDPVPHLKPAQDLLDVCLHRVLAEMNPAGDLLVRQALGKQTQDLLLAVVEPGPGRSRLIGIHPEGNRHALPLQRHKFIPLRLTQVLVKLLEPDNHLLLVLVQARVVDRHGDLVGEGGQEALVVGPIAFPLIRYPDHADHLGAQLERHPEKGPDVRMPRGFTHPYRVILDIIRDVRAAFGDHDPEDTGPEMAAAPSEMFAEDAPS